MVFEKERERQRKKRAKNCSTWKKRFYKFVFLTGLAITFKGLKGLLWSKKSDIMS